MERKLEKSVFVGTLAVAMAMPYTIKENNPSFAASTYMIVKTLENALDGVDDIFFYPEVYVSQRD